MSTYEKKNKAGLSIGTWHLIVLLVLLILAAVFMGFRYYRSIYHQIFSERQIHIEEINEKSASVVGTAVESAWNRIGVCEAVVGSAEGLSEENFKYVLSDAHDHYEYDEDILAFDSRGNCYTSDEEVFRFSKPGMLTSDAPDRQMAIMSFNANGAEDDLNLVLIRKTEKPAALQNSSIVFLGLSIDMNNLKEAFTVNSFGNSGALYIVNADGARIYKNTSSHDLIQGYNFLEELNKNARFVYGSTIQEFEQSFHSEVPNTCEIQLDGKNYFISCVRIPSSDWSMIEMVPSEVLGANTTQILRETLRLFVGALIILLLCGIVVVSLILSKRHSERMAQTEQEAREKLEELNTQLEIATQEAKSASEAKSSFLSNMSHDIRTPINGIMGMTGIAIKNIDDKAKVQDCLKKIDGASNHLLSLVNDVLDLSRIESGKTVCAHEPMDIRTVCENCASIIGGQLVNRQVELVRDFDAFEHPHVFGDELHLRQVFVNILGNSVKFTPDGGKITFRARERKVDDDHTVLTFVLEDTGIGMKPEFLPHIFEAFSMEDNGARTTYKGTGLGMAITKQFVDLMQGTIKVESELNVGSRFTIEIPFDIDHEAAASAVMEKDEAGICSLEGMKILLAEDNELNAEIAVELLEEEGAILDLAENGQIALNKFENNPAGTYDVILMDVMMPVMDGLTATRAIRALPREDAKTIAIIAMTANAFDEDIRKTREAGMNAHLSKPINPAFVIKTLASFNTERGKE